MTIDSDPAGEFRTRLDRVAERLQAHATARPAPGLTDPDPPTGERWDWGQVWAHLAEFVPYWMSQITSTLQATAPEPPAFGRTKADPERIAAIERDRHRPPSELWSRLQGQLDELRRFLEELPPKAWSKQGRHPTLGAMDVRRMVEEFVVGHLEAHTEQLDGLSARPPARPESTGR